MAVKLNSPSKLQGTLYFTVLKNTAKKVLQHCSQITSYLADDDGYRPQITYTYDGDADVPIIVKPHLTPSKPTAENTHFQCDQMVKLFVQYLAIYCIENVLNSIRNCFR